MEVFTLQPKVSITITPDAAVRIRQIMEKHGKPEAGLRIRILAGGCAGLQYKFEVADSPMKGDNIIEQEGAKVFVDPKSTMFLMGSRIEYVDELMSSGFRISNPNAKGKCSCGESFTA